MKLLNRAGWTCVGLFALGLSLSQAQTPLVEYKFNETGSPSSIGSTGTNTLSATYSGTVGAATGVSGAAGDYAFQSTTAMGTGAGGVYASSSLLTSSLYSMTITGWFNTSTTIGSAARLADDYNSSGPAGFTLRAASSGEAATYGGGLVFSVDGQTAYSGLNTYADTGSWVFFAATYSHDATNSYVTFYKGTVGSAVVQVGSTITLATAVGSIDMNSIPLTIGDLTAANRSFQGLLDDFRIYGSTTDNTGALSLSQLETIRGVDAVPEPATMSLMGIAAVLLLVGRFNGRRICG